MNEPTLADKVVALDQALADARVPHAFGGALALAYYSEPHATQDVDINVFTPAERWQEVAAILGPLGVDCTTDEAALLRDGQVRWRWGRTPVDVFFSYDELHDAMRASSRSYSFGSTTIPVLSPEHLAVCKILFNRPKDWIDLEGMLAATEGFATNEVRQWLDRFVGADDERRARFDALTKAILGEPSP